MEHVRRLLLLRRLARHSHRPLKQSKALAEAARRRDRLHRADERLGAHLRTELGVGLEIIKQLERAPPVALARERRDRRLVSDDVGRTPRLACSLSSASALAASPPRAHAAIAAP